MQVAIAVVQAFSSTNKWWIHCAKTSWLKWPPLKVAEVSELIEQNIKNTVIIHQLPHSLLSFKELAKTLVCYPTYTSSYASICWHLSNFELDNCLWTDTGWLADKCLWMDGNFGWMVTLFWNSLIILPTCSMNPETAVTMDLLSLYNKIFFAVIKHLWETLFISGTWYQSDCRMKSHVHVQVSIFCRMNYEKIRKYVAQVQRLTFTVGCLCGTSSSTIHHMLWDCF